MKFFKSFMGKIAIAFVMALMFGALGHTNVQAATIGQQLLKPEIGWQRIEDTNTLINYINGFTSNSDPSWGGGNAHIVTTDVQWNMRFKFYGTRFRILGAMASNRPKKVNIKIDGVLQSQYSCYKVSTTHTYTALLFDSPILNIGTHVVEIYREPSEHHEYDLDAIDIDDTGYLIDSSTNIALNKATDNLQVGQTDDLTATITPDTATNKPVKWTSDKPEVATVDENGKVTAIKEGTATITVTTQDGSNLSATCIVTVKAKDATPTNPTQPTDNNGNAILTITMTNGNVKAYTVPMSKVNDFISWYNNRASGSNEKAYCTFDKTDSLQPFSKKTEHIVFDKISSFEVDEYDKK